MHHTGFEIWRISIFWFVYKMTEYKEPIIVVLHSTQSAEWSSWWAWYCPRCNTNNILGEELYDPEMIEAECFGKDCKFNRNVKIQDLYLLPKLDWIEQETRQQYKHIESDIGCPIESTYFTDLDEDNATELEASPTSTPVTETQGD